MESNFGVFSFGLLFIGAWLLTLAFAASGLQRVLLRVACALVFLLSFALNSTIVLYAFVMLGLFVAIWRGGNASDGFVRRTWLASWRTAIRYPELVMLPLIYWGSLNIWFKRTGVYAQHYDAHFPTLRELAGMAGILRRGLPGRPRPCGARRDHRSDNLHLAAMLVGIVLLLLRSDTKPTLSRLGILVPLVLAVTLFLALSSPYLIAGLRPSSTHFYESRHLLMFGVPAALAFLALKRLTERWTSPGFAFAIVFGWGLIVSIGMLWSDYVFMQARTLKQEALARNLAGRFQPAATVYALDDGFFDYPSRHVPFGIAEVTGMLHLAWGNQPFFGFALRAERPGILREMNEARKAPGSAFHHYDPSGPQATISFQPGSGAAPNQTLVRQYYACRLLARCDVAELLAQLAQVAIKLGPIAGILPIETDAAPSR